MHAQIADSRVVSIENSNHYTIVSRDDFVTETLAFLAG
jgi:hypothetical protein